jgi:4-amino-4-deoxy-L-arabinose transferase-like glycosyltransferase
MFIVLIPVFYILLWTVFFDRQPNGGLREIFLKTTLLFFGFVAITTEILSLFHLINKISLVTVWAIADAALFIFARQKIKNTVGEMWKDLRGKIVEVPKFYLTLLIFIYSMILLLALVSPPNTYDSMTYHLARIANWIQFSSVEFYPTAIVRQLYQPPLAEYSLLHFQILSGGDYFSNLIQWFSLISCGLVVSLITREFGQNLKTQKLAVFLSATLPAAIVQGSSTQNDLVISLFILAFFYFWIRAVKSNSWTDFCWVGLALALALLTKGTAYIYCFPIGAFFVVVHFLTLEKKMRWRFIKQVAVVLVMAIALNAGQYTRNYNLFGAPVTSGNDEVRNKNLTAKMVFSNLVRNYAINLGTKSAGLKNLLEGVMTATFGDELKNPDSTWLENEFRITYSTHEDSTGNFIHILLITLVLPVILLIRTDEKKYIYGAVFSILSGFILLALLLKWQIYGSRLQMPLFLLGCALAAIVIARLPRRVVVSVVLIAFVFSLSSLFFAQPRAIFSGDLKFVLTQQTRKQKFFANLPDAEILYSEAAQFIKQQPNAPESVGLMLDFNDYEYPFWFLLKNDFSQKPTIHHVGITNISSKLVGTRPLPEFVISIRTENTIEGIEYKEVWKNNVVRVLQKNAP